jgi:hypothetical protein
MPFGVKAVAESSLVAILVVIVITLDFIQCFVVWVPPGANPRGVLEFPYSVL